MEKELSTTDATFKTDPLTSVKYVRVDPSLTDHTIPIATCTTSPSTYTVGYYPSDNSIELKQWAINTALEFNNQKSSINSDDLIDIADKIYKYIIKKD
jgi:hypothetical protein